MSGTARAVQRVTSNDGKRTPGVDRIIWDTPAKHADAMNEVRQRGYRPRPLRRISIPKTQGTTRQRPWSIPPMHDRAMPALSLLALAPIAETQGDPNSYGFRTERSTADASGPGCTALARKRSPQWMWEGDIRACFDGISHEGFVAHIPMEHAMLQQWLQAGCRDQHVLYPTEAGVPQGGIASPGIANLALDGLEGFLRVSSPRSTRRAKQAQVHLVRYADDCSITGRSYDLLEQDVQPLVEQLLRQRGLELSQEHTRSTHLETGVDFLGQ